MYAKYHIYHNFGTVWYMTLKCKANAKQLQLRSWQIFMYRH